jgi:hypothetical protein
VSNSSKKTITSSHAAGLFGVRGGTYSVGKIIITRKNTGLESKPDDNKPC